MRYFVFYLNDCDCDWIVGVVSSLLFGELCLSTLVFTVEFFLSLSLLRMVCNCLFFWKWIHWVECKLFDILKFFAVDVLYF